MAENTIKKIEKIFLTLKNNDKLQKALDDNYLILKRGNYVGQYTEEAFIEKVSEIEDENYTNLYKLATLLYANLETITTSKILDLIGNYFLKFELSNIFEGVEIEESTLKEIFFCVKYCDVSSFFQNNRGYFLPNIDFQKIEENTKLDIFMDATLKEFDKLSNVLKEIKNITDIEEIPLEYINYLSQLLGYEKKDVPTLNEDSFRELVKNIIEIYKIKGTTYSFELFFSFLGFSVAIEEYFFDRRYFFSLNFSNEHTLNINPLDFNHYLTTENPFYNKTSFFNISETVSYNDIGPQYSLSEFNDLANLYGAEAVLGYSKLDKEGELYTNKVFTYFKTNYIYYTLGGLSNTIEESKAIKKYLDFLTPVFILTTVETSVNQELSPMNITFIDLEKKISSIGIISNPRKEQTIYIYANKNLSQNSGHNLIYSRLYKYREGRAGTAGKIIYDGTLHFEVPPARIYNTDKNYLEQNEFYEKNENSVIDFEAIKQTKIENKGVYNRTKITISDLTVAGYLDSKLDLTQTKIFKNDFKEIKILTTQGIVTDPSLIFNSEAYFSIALNTDTFRAKLRTGLVIAVAVGNSWKIRRYQMNKVILFTETNLPVNTKGTFTGETFETLVNATAYYEGHPALKKINIEFYISEEQRFYSFLYSNRKIGDKVWFSTIKKLYEFVDGVDDDSFKEVSLKGTINGEYIEFEEAYPFYDEDEDKKTYIFYHNNQISVRPNVHKSVETYKNKTDEDISLDIFKYTEIFYNNLSYKKIDEINKIIDTFSAYSSISLPFVLQNIYSENFNDENSNIYSNLLAYLKNTNIWVSNFGSANVSKINVSTNTVVEAVTVGTNPHGVAFDGTNIWVANSGGTTVSKINVSTNTVVEAVTVGTNPHGVAFDGTNIWVSNYGSANVSKINVSTNTVVETVTVGTNPHGVALSTNEIFLENESRLISLLTLFQGDWNIQKPLIKDFFAKLNYISELNSWREKYFNDENYTINSISSNPLTTIILNNLKPKFGFSYGRIDSPINNISPNSFSYFKGSTYEKVVLPFYHFSIINNTTFGFYIRQLDLLKYFNIRDVFNSSNQYIEDQKVLRFLNAVYTKETYSNSLSYINTSFMKIIGVELSGVTSENVFKILATSTKTYSEKKDTTSNSILGYPAGYIYLNNFKNILSNNKLIQPKGIEYIERNNVTEDPVEYVSFGYDKETYLRIVDTTTFNLGLSSHGTYSNGIITTNKVNLIGLRSITLNYIYQVTPEELHEITVGVSRIVVSAGTTTIYLNNKIDSLATAARIFFKEIFLKDK